MNTRNAFSRMILNILTAMKVYLGNVLLNGATAGTDAVGVIAHKNGTVSSTQVTDCYEQYAADQTAGNACPHFKTENGGVVKLFKGAALTAQLTTITPADAAGTPDYAIAAITNSSPFGFASAAEAITCLYVIANLQVRLAEVEARLEANGLVTAN